MQIDDRETTTTLREENKSLRKEVNILKVRNTERTKEIWNVESEKASLVTSLRILYMDVKAREDNHEDGIVKSKLEKENQVINRNDGKQDGNNEQTWTEVKQRRQINGKKDKENFKQAEANADDQRVNKRFSAVVISDSTISWQQDWRMSNKKNKVAVRSFAGTRINDLYHYFVPSLETQPMV